MRINGKHRGHLMFLFEKAISPKVVWAGGNLSILCQHETFSHTWERNKNRALWKCWQSLIEEWANIQDSFESLPKLCKVWIFWGGSVHFTPDVALRISMLFFTRNWPSNMSGLLCERVLFHFRKLFPYMVDPFCTKPCINNTNVAQLSINTPGIDCSQYDIIPIWNMNHDVVDMISDIRYDIVPIWNMNHHVAETSLRRCTVPTTSVQTQS